MKKHLFYTFLGIFALTAIVTLLGIVKAVEVDEFYLKGLFSALLLELVGAVVALYRKIELPNEEALSISEANQSPNTSTISILTKDTQIKSKGESKNKNKNIESIGINDCYLREDRSSIFLPMASADFSIRLIGGSLCKFASEISELVPQSNRKIEIILPDPQEKRLIKMWVDVLPDTPRDYYNDVIFTLNTLRKHISTGMVDIRLTSKIPLSSLTSIDNKQLIIEYSFYRFQVSERIMIDIDPDSPIGQRYSNQFQELFSQCRKLDTSNDVDNTINMWKQLL